MVQTRSMTNKGHQGSPRSPAVDIKSETAAPNDKVNQGTSGKKRARQINTSRATPAKKVKREPVSPIDSAAGAPVSPVSNVLNDFNEPDVSSADDPDDSELEEDVKPEETTTFFDLPPELRTEIYQLVLPVGEPINVVPSFPHFRRHRLLAVNQLIRAEASPIFYSTNFFQISGTAFCNRFLRSTSDEVLQALRCVRVLNSDTAKLDDWSKKWFQYVKKHIVHLQDTYEDRGLSAGVIRYPVTVDGGQIWANVKDLESIAAGNNGCVAVHQVRARSFDDESE